MSVLVVEEDVEVLSANESHEVLEWLGIDGDGVPYYLHPLNLKWTDAGSESDLARFRSVALRLQADHPYWSTIIREANWRYTLVGCVCVLLSKPAAFFTDLAFRFEAGSMVTPQIAVTLGLVYPQQTADLLAAFLRKADAIHRPREYVAAEMVLERLGLKSSLPIDRLKEWSSVLAVDDAALAESVVQEHWSFWSHLDEPR